MRRESPGGVALIEEDSVEVGWKNPTRLVSRQRPINLEERVLGGVGGSRIAAEAARGDMQRPRLVPPHQRIERQAHTPTRQQHQLVVGVARERRAVRRPSGLGTSDRRCGALPHPY